MDKKVTILITTWNSLEFLRLCLDKLFEYTSIPFDLIISDNGSTDGTKEYVQEVINTKKGDILYLRSENNEGAIQGRTRAEPYINTKYVVLLDCDSIVSKDWLTVFIDIVEKNPKIKVVGPMKQATQYKYPGGNDLNSRKIWEQVKADNPDKSPAELLEIYCNGKSYEEFVEEFVKVNRNSEKMLTCPPELLSGCCLFIDFEFFKLHGGIANPVFGKYGGQDADRCWKAAKGGGLVFRTDKVYIHHFEGSSLKKNNLDYRPMLYENNRKLLDIWENEIWEFIKKEGKPLVELAKEYWLIRELVLSANKEQIPEKYLSEVEQVKKTFTSTV